MVNWYHHLPSIAGINPIIFSGCTKRDEGYQKRELLLTKKHIGNENTYKGHSLRDRQHLILPFLQPLLLRLWTAIPRLETKKG